MSDIALAAPDDLAANQRLRLAGGYRLQFEPAQGRFVLLYPEGMVELSDSAAAVLKKCNGEGPLARSEIIDALQCDYPGADIAQDVHEFLGEALQRGWLIPVGAK